jgi:hypothetical protein
MSNGHVAIGHRHRLPHRVLLTVVCCLQPHLDAVAAPLPQDPSVAESLSGAALTPDDERRLAERFAPVLVFHPEENYFPTSPLFPLDLATDEASAAQSPAALLGTASSRRERYQALTMPQKAQISTVYYRAYPARLHSQDVVVVEYWFYYVHNRYRIRGNLLPIWVDGSHPNDLEHVHVVLRPSADESGFAAQEVHASSHAGTMPFNRYRYTDEDETSGRLLVELGSHAMASDIDEDGVFTPGADGDSGYKLVWGIRDRGITWARYSRSYMETRETGATVLEYGGDAARTERLSYRLVHVEALTEAFDELDLTDRQRTAIFETDRHWFRRLFGGDNGSSSTLLVPPVRDHRSRSIGVESIASAERGLLVGSVLNLEEQAAFVGARYAYMHGIKYVPDVMIEADAVRGVRHGYVSAQMLLSYPIDGSIKLLGGKAFVADSIRFDRTQWNWTGGVEIRLGRMRIYGGSRSLGSIVPYAKEFRLAYFF